MLSFKANEKWGLEGTRCRKVGKWRGAASAQQNPSSRRFQPKRRKRAALRVWQCNGLRDVVWGEFML